jgi:hypothetical protein
MNSPTAWSGEYLMGKWHPGFHDDYFIGWLITSSYFACALLAALIATFHRQMEEKLAVKFWHVVSLIMVLLGLNKQLALQILLTEIGRHIAQTQGWYDQRRILQFSFIIVFAVTFTTASIWFAMKYRDSLRRYMLVFCGLFFLLGFVIIRAATFHHFNELIQIELFYGLTMNWALELAGIYMIILAEVREIIVSTLRNRG